MFTNNLNQNFIVLFHCVIVFYIVRYIQPSLSNFWFGGGAGTLVYTFEDIKLECVLRYGVRWFLTD